MKNSMRNVARVILMAAVAAGCGSAQQAAPQKHVKDILADQPRELISASSLCQRAWASPVFSDGIDRKVNPATVEPDLEHIMADSDEVILASSSGIFTSAISPSGNDAYKYYDVKVIRAWKGNHQVGDLITFAVPRADLSCWGPQALRHGGAASFHTGTDGWQGDTGGPFILFLRKTGSDQTQFIPGYRLTGAEGAQGLFGVPHSPTATEWDKCDISASLKGLENCNTYLESSPATVNAGFGGDSLFKKYDGMPISDFLNEVQATADKLGYAPQDNDAN